MATDVDIVNMALGYLGDAANVSSLNPPEPTFQAEMASKYYPIARDAALSRHSWSFNLRRATLPRLATPPAFGWRHAFALPHDCLRVLSVHRADAYHDQLPLFSNQRVMNTRALKPFSGGSVAFSVAELDNTQQRAVYCDEENVVARYRARVTDPGHFSADFVVALAWLLASQMAGPLLKGDEGARMAQEALRIYEALAEKAQAADAVQNRAPSVYVPAPLLARLGRVGPFDEVG